MKTGHKDSERTWLLYTILHVKSLFAEWMAWRHELKNDDWNMKLNLIGIINCTTKIKMPTKET